MSAELPYPVEVRCQGPEHCLDDMCANSDVGLCGVPRLGPLVDHHWPEDDEELYDFGEGDDE